MDQDKKGCINVLKAFIDYISERETENFRTRRHDNENSVTLTTIHQVFSSQTSCLFPRTSRALTSVIIKCVQLSFHLIFFVLLVQSKGLEWDIVFVAKVIG